MLLTKDTLEATLELNRLAWRGLVLEIEKDFEDESSSYESITEGRRTGGTKNVCITFACQSSQYSVCLLNFLESSENFRNLETGHCHVWDVV